MHKYLADAGFDVSMEEAMLLTDENADDTALEKLWDKLVAKGMTEEKYNKIFQKIPLFIGYNNLAGEVEFRNAVTRSRMSMEERRQSLLDETADVAPEDRIYIMEQAGVSEQAKRIFTEEQRQQEVQKLTIFTKNYSDLLEYLKNDSLQKDKEFALGETPDALIITGVPPLQISIRGSVLYKALEKHNLSIEQLKKIPSALYNPVMIFDSTDQSTNHDSGMVVLTQINDNNGKPVIIALNIEKTSSFHKINDIASIYGKDNVNQIIKWIDDGFLKYSHRKRALAFARFHRLSLPKKATISERSNPTIIDESPNINPASTKNPENSLSTTLTPEEVAELENNEQLAEDSKNKGADEKHLTLSQAISMLGLDTSDIEVENDTDSDLKLSMAGDVDTGQENHPYYDIPFKDSVDMVIDPTNKTNRKPVFVSETPSIYREIGFTAMPMMMNQRHLQLNYFTEKEFVERFGKIDKKKRTCSRFA